MKQISVDIQRRIMFVPVINIANIFIWLFNARNAYKTVNTLPRTLLILFSSVIPLEIISLVVANYSPDIGNIIGLLNAYLGPLAAGYWLIKYQEKLPKCD